MRDYVEKEWENLVETRSKGMSDSGPSGGGQDQGLKLLRNHSHQLQQQGQRTHVWCSACKVIVIRTFQSRSNSGARVVGSSVRL